MPENELIPSQKDGAQTDVIEKVDLQSVADAEAHFELAEKRLLEVFNWDKICELPSSVFILVDQTGEKIRRRAMVGDYFMIDIPAPGNARGDGYDWVKIEQIETRSLPDGKETAMQVRPCPNPFDETNATAHFFDDKATSTFLVRRQATTLFAEVHGRNETANTETGAFINDLRNALVAWGAKAGFSFPQWKALVMGILKSPLENNKA